MKLGSRRAFDSQVMANGQVRSKTQSTLHIGTDHEVRGQLPNRAKPSAGASQYSVMQYQKEVERLRKLEAKLAEIRKQKELRRLRDESRRNAKITYRAACVIQYFIRRIVQRRRYNTRVIAGFLRMAYARQAVSAAAWAAKIIRTFVRKLVRRFKARRNKRIRLRRAFVNSYCTRILEAASINASHILILAQIQAAKALENERIIQTAREAPSELPSPVQKAQMKPKQGPSKHTTEPAAKKPIHPWEKFNSPRAPDESTSKDTANRRSMNKPTTKSPQNGKESTSKGPGKGTKSSVVGGAEGRTHAKGKRTSATPSTGNASKDTGKLSHGPAPTRQSKVSPKAAPRKSPKANQDGNNDKFSMKRGDNVPIQLSQALARHNAGDTSVLPHILYRNESKKMNSSKNLDSGSVSPMLSRQASNKEYGVSRNDAKETASDNQSPGTFVVSRVSLDLDALNAPGKITDITMPNMPAEKDIDVSISDVVASLSAQPNDKVNENTTSTGIGSPPVAHLPLPSKPSNSLSTANDGSTSTESIDADAMLKVRALLLAQASQIDGGDEVASKIMTLFEGLPSAEAGAAVTIQSPSSVGKSPSQTNSKPVIKNPLGKHDRMKPKPHVQHARSSVHKQESSKDMKGPKDIGGASGVPNGRRGSRVSVVSLSSLANRGGMGNLSVAADFGAPMDRNSIAKNLKERVSGTMELSDDDQERLEKIKNHHQQRMSEMEAEKIARLRQIEFEKAAKAAEEERVRIEKEEERRRKSIAKKEFLEKVERENEIERVRQAKAQQEKEEMETLVAKEEIIAVDEGRLMWREDVSAKKIRSHERAIKVKERASLKAQQEQMKKLKEEEEKKQRRSQLNMISKDILDSMKERKKQRQKLQKQCSESSISEDESEGSPTQDRKRKNSLSRMAPVIPSLVSVPDEMPSSDAEDREWEATLSIKSARAKADADVHADTSEDVDVNASVGTTVTATPIESDQTGSTGLTGGGGLKVGQTTHKTASTSPKAESTQKKMPASKKELNSYGGVVPTGKQKIEIEILSGTVGSPNPIRTEKSSEYLEMERLLDHAKNAKPAIPKFSSVRAQKSTDTGRETGRDSESEAGEGSPKKKPGLPKPSARTSKALKESTAGKDVPTEKTPAKPTVPYARVTSFASKPSKKKPAPIDGEKVTAATRPSAKTEDENGDDDVDSDDEKGMKAEKPGKNAEENREEKEKEKERKEGYDVALEREKERLKQQNDLQEALRKDRLSAEGIKRSRVAVQKRLSQRREKDRMQKELRDQEERHKVHEQEKVALLAQISVLKAIAAKTHDKKNRKSKKNGGKNRGSVGMSDQPNVQRESDVEFEGEFKPLPIPIVSEESDGDALEWIMSQTALPTKQSGPSVIPNAALSSDVQTSLQQQQEQQSSFISEEQSSKDIEAPAPSITFGTGMKDSSNKFEFGNIDSFLENEIGVSLSATKLTDSRKMALMEDDLISVNVNEMNNAEMQASEMSSMDMYGNSVVREGGDSDTVNYASYNSMSDASQDADADADGGSNSFVFYDGSRQDQVGTDAVIGDNPFFVMESVGDLDGAHTGETSSNTKIDEKSIKKPKKNTKKASFASHDSDVDAYAAGAEAGHGGQRRRTTPHANTRKALNFCVDDEAEYSDGNDEAQAYLTKQPQRRSTPHAGQNRGRQRSEFQKGRASMKERASMSKSKSKSPKRKKNGGVDALSKKSTKDRSPKRDRKKPGAGAGENSDKKGKVNKLHSMIDNARVKLGNDHVAAARQYAEDAGYGGGDEMQKPSYSNEAYALPRVSFNRKLSDELPGDYLDRLSNKVTSISSKPQAVNVNMASLMKLDPLSDEVMANAASADVSIARVVPPTEQPLGPWKRKLSGPSPSASFLQKMPSAPQLPPQVSYPSRKPSGHGQGHLQPLGGGSSGSGGSGGSSAVPATKLAAKNVTVSQGDSGGSGPVGTHSIAAAIAKNIVNSRTSRTSIPMIIKDDKDDGDDGEFLNVNESFSPASALLKRDHEDNDKVKTGEYDGSHLPHTKGDDSDNGNDSDAEEAELEKQCAELREHLASQSSHSHPDPPNNHRPSEVDADDFMSTKPPSIDANGTDLQASSVRSAAPMEVPASDRGSASSISPQKEPRDEVSIEAPGAKTADPNEDGANANPSYHPNPIKNTSADKDKDKYMQFPSVRAIKAKSSPGNGMTFDMSASQPIELKEYEPSNPLYERPLDRDQFISTLKNSSGQMTEYSMKFSSADGDLGSGSGKESAGSDAAYDDDFNSYQNSPMNRNNDVIQAPSERHMSSKESSSKGIGIASVDVAEKNKKRSESTSKTDKYLEMLEKHEASSQSLVDLEKLSEELFAEIYQGPGGGPGGGAGAGAGVGGVHGKRVAKIAKEKADSSHTASKKSSGSLAGASSVNGSGGSSGGSTRGVPVGGGAANNSYKSRQKNQRNQQNSSGIHTSVSKEGRRETASGGGTAIEKECAELRAELDAQVASLNIDLSSKLQELTNAGLGEVQPKRSDGAHENNNDKDEDVERRRDGESLRSQAAQRNDAEDNGDNYDDDYDDYDDDDDDDGGGNEEKK